jgi:hypothetical protein
MLVAKPIAATSHFHVHAKQWLLAVSLALEQQRAEAVVVDTRDAYCTFCVLFAVQALQRSRLDAVWMDGIQAERVF